MVIFENISALLVSFGLLGLFAVAILENATLFVGVPLEVILVGFAFATKGNLIIIAVVAGLGAAIGEMTGYLVGRAGVGLAQKIKKTEVSLFDKLKEKVDKHGPIGVFLLLLLPIPFDLVGIAAGLAKMNPLKFYLATFAGKSVRYFIILVAATAGIKMLLSFFGVGL
ncbi:MAG: VTT domain-containing protein [Candidatus Micrarchaeota archaeon]